MATTVGKIESLLPGCCNKRVSLISHRQEKDIVAEIVMNPDFMKSPSLQESHHVKWYFTLIEHLHFYLLFNWMWIYKKFWYELWSKHTCALQANQPTSSF